MTNPRKGPEFRPYLYFAYGSNLDVDRMSIRCPLARPVRPYTLRDWRLVFRGVADIIPDKGHQVRGGLYRITADDEAALDRYEGYPSLYTKVWFQDPDQGLIMAYVMNGRKSGLGDWAMPGEFYLDIIRQGYDDWEIPVRGLNSALAFTRGQVRQAAHDALAITGRA